MPVTLQSSSLLRSFSRHHLISNQRSQQPDTRVVSILLPQLFILYPWNVLQPAPRAVPSPAAVLPPSTADLPGSRGGQGAPQLVCRRVWNQGRWVSPFVFKQGKVKLQQIAVAGESTAPSFCTVMCFLQQEEIRGFFHSEAGWCGFVGGGVSFI